MYCVSLPIVILCLVFAFCIMLISFMCETLVVENRKAAGDDSVTGSIIIALPSITYAGLVYVMNLYYKKLATFLTDWGMYIIFRLLHCYYYYYCYFDVIECILFRESSDSVSIRPPQGDETSLVRVYKQFHVNVLHSVCYTRYGDVEIPTGDHVNYSSGVQ